VLQAPCSGWPIVDSTGVAANSSLPPIARKVWPNLRQRSTGPPDFDHKVAERRPV